MTLRFVSSHRPPLLAGHYRVRVGQHLLTDGGNVALGAFSSAVDEVALEFAALGPRLALPSGTIVGRFPPAGSAERNAAVLPHVVFDDATLPWIRRPWAGAGGRLAPWLALLVLNGEQAARVVRTTTTARAIGRADEPGQDPSQPVQLIKVPAGLATALLPAAADLPFLAHVRESGEPVVAQSVLVANTLPTAGSAAEVHLVSIEGLYGPGLPAGDVDLVVLDSWSFSCAADGASFRELATALAHNNGPLRQAATNPMADAHLQRGVIALPHGRTASFYRGPLVPANGDRPMYRALEILEKLPRHSDELLLFDESINMLDTSYAVAFELGRSLTLANSEVATQLDQWIRAERRALRRGSQLQGVAQHREPRPTAPSLVVEWFNRLAALDVVPGRYLLADVDRLVPADEATWTHAGQTHTAPGRIAFFVVDAAWILSLLHGAFSIGRMSEGEHAYDEQLAIPIDFPGRRSGCVIRSPIVAYDDVEIRAWIQVGGPGAAADLQGEPLVSTLRRLDAETLVAMFHSPVAATRDEQAGTIEIRRKPVGLHFGLESSTGRLVKNQRDHRGNVIDAEIDVHLRDGGRAVQIARLADDLGATDAADFALHMIVGTPRVQFWLTHEAVS